MQKFDKSKRYKFSKEIYLTITGNAMYYNASVHNRRWVDKYDNEEITVIDGEGRIGNYEVKPGWCEEIIPHMTQIVREVADKRYKTALEKVLEQHPKMDAGKIVRYGCPYRYGVGVEPVWCDDSLKTVDQCRKCWNQKEGELV